MPKQEDKKRLLADTLLSMIDSAPLDQITVSALTRECGLSRQTFYYHFSAIDDLLAWTLHQEVLKTVRPVRGEGQHARLRAVLERLYESRQTVEKVVRFSSSDSRLDALFKQELGIYVMRTVEEVAVGLDFAPSDRALIARFYAAGLLEIIRIWIDDGMREPPDHLSERLAAIVVNSPELVVRMSEGYRL